LQVHGCGLHGLQEAGDYLDVGNSGTTIRFLSGCWPDSRFSPC
jgi:5-enolpyruvylshikimate-3-phosphate synthase